MLKGAEGEISEGHSYLSFFRVDSRGPYQLGLETRQERLAWVLLAAVLLGGKFGFRT